ncbi:hypothetical protein CAPTEDRAFT_204143 [Capitella teleta]|uniref:Major facilitator superfamily (MFS) profile domain-containing protein n=1 Tax=Capitella teleta TaxID=283909 RepID=R7UCR6_CAPTE|nr:hypothetical protein CAPTEDRAFT_204143 [Capitella teleta]|eukprot:ELU01583.1 hypothetical protein CAPTEDRAFT_204143 [Capitella teleta]
MGSMTDTIQSGRSHRSISLHDLPQEVRQRLVSIAPTMGLAETAIEESIEATANLNRGPPQPSIENARSWQMLVAAFIFQSLYGLALFSPPIYLVTFVEYFDISNLTASWLGSIYIFCCFSIGVVATPLIQNYGCLLTAFAASVAMVIVRALSSLAPNVAMIFVFQSIIAGFAAGTAFVGANVILTKYFDRHRALATSFGLTGIGVGMIAAPVFIAALIEEYGWRGCVLLETATLAHMIPISLLFAEPKDQSKKYTIDANPVTSTHATTPDTAVVAKKSCCKIISDFSLSAFDFTMLKDKLFSLYCFSNFLTRVNSATTLCHLVNYIVSEGFTVEDGALVMSISGVSCMVARVTASLLTNRSSLNHLGVYGVVMLLNAASSVLFLYLPGFIPKCFAAVLFGFAFGFDYTFVPVILVQMMGVDFFARSLAMYNLFSLGIATITVPAVAGLMYDLTGTYDIPLLAGAIAGTVGCVLAGISAVMLSKQIKQDEVIQ